MIRSTFGASTSAITRLPLTSIDVRVRAVIRRDLRRELPDVRRAEVRAHEAVAEPVEVEQVGEQAVELARLVRGCPTISSRVRWASVAPLSFSVTEKPMIDVSGVRSS